MFLGIVVFLFLLAIFDLVVGVSNDAVNFMNSAIGAKAASFKTIIAIAAFGIFIGATLSNGMMEIARHGIFRPEQFYFQELMCIFLAVMVTDVVLLDIFNSLGMPTSTTVSMVFELLGGTFVLALIKIAEDETGMLGFADLLNTEKALSVILGIFLSVAVAFFFGTLVQYLSRLLFTFNYTKKLPIDYRCNKEATKRAFRIAAKRHIPEATANKKKLGFPVPIRVWLKEDKYYNKVMEKLTGETAKKYFDTVALKKLMEDHRNGKADNSRKIWTVYVFLIWHEVYMESDEVNVPA